MLTPLQQSDPAIDDRMIRFRRRLDWMQGAAIAAFVIYVGALVFVG